MTQELVAADSTAGDVENVVRIPAGVHDLDSLRRWAHSDQFPEWCRISYLSGEIEIDMSPEELRHFHQPRARRARLGCVPTSTCNPRRTISSMQVIPVIDLQGGTVVHAVAGMRHRYRPLSSVLCNSSRPDDVARAFVERLGADMAYVADLDAIAGAAPAWDTYRRLGEHGLRLLIDAGIDGLPRAAAMHRFAERSAAVSSLVIGLESLASPEALESICRHFTPRPWTFSLDLKHGQPLLGADWPAVPAVDIAHRSFNLGIHSLIVLDLAGVGTSQGCPVQPLCARLRREMTGQPLRLIAGGGVRHRGDLDGLASAGCDAALVASALHHGAIGRIGH